MSEVKVKIQKSDGTVELESLYGYCSKLSKRNNAILYRLESFLGKKLLEEPELADIRDIVLTVSADISKLSSHLHLELGDVDEGL
jgi:hypothetical protein